MKLSIIVTTYNRPDALQAVLAGYLTQTDAPFEVLVADDGSTADTKAVVEQFQIRAPFVVQHVWHEDLGFRAAAIRNRAIAASSADYLVFTDGDCVPPPDFVACHRKLAEANCFVSGNRLMLMRGFTEQVLREQIPIHLWTVSDWLKARWQRHILRVLPLLRLPDSPLRKLAARRWQGAKTCNLGVFRSDLYRVNGLDESYTGWGLEDSDLVIRLIRAGVVNKTARFSAPLFHLWHKDNDRSHLPENQQRLEALLHSTHIRAVQGLERV